MRPIERHDRIEQALRTTRVLGTEDIARQLDVSVETIRRDFMTLEQRGLLTRVHGGAIAGGSAYALQEPPFVDRALLANGGKAAIGRTAAAMVSDGQTVVMDVGTTVLAVARALPPGFRGTVATCSLLVAAELAEREHVEVLLSGGRVRGGDLAVSNSQTLGFFADLRADIAFLGSGGIDAAAGLTDFHVDEVATRRLLIANASAAWVLADASKLGLVAPHRVCGLDAIDGVITDAGAAPELDHALRQAGGRLVCTGGQLAPDQP